jgi:hypothetical protein
VPVLSAVRITSTETTVPAPFRTQSRCEWTTWVSLRWMASYPGVFVGRSALLTLNQEFLVLLQLPGVLVGVEVGVHHRVAELVLDVLGAGLPVRSDDWSTPGGGAGASFEQPEAVRVSRPTSASRSFGERGGFCLA